MRVLILGCGPAGLLAAHAAEEMGAEPVILSRRRKSPMRGAQYLHEPIPGLPDYEFKVNYVMTGSMDGYRRKVYGTLGAVLTVSPEHLQGLRQAWDIRAVYDALWASYGPSVIDWEAYPFAVLEAVDRFKPDHVISTIPATAICANPVHEFRSAVVMVSESARYLPPDLDNVVVCSGETVHLWYRQSRIFGHENTEYPYRGWNGEPTMMGSQIPSSEVRVAKVAKPVLNTCDCFPEIRRMGRYGRWEKGVLSHSAYYETKRMIDGA